MSEPEVTRADEGPPRTRRCPTCGDWFAAPLMLCPSDASVLEREAEQDLPDPLVGRIFGGRFAIKERLGAGGMGAVYRAEQLSIGREVALKVLHPSFAARADSAQRFAREARMLSRLHHPTVVTLFDFGQAETGELFLAMELLHGETLGARLDRGPVPVPQAIKIADAIAEALAIAHAGGMVHRDLKPDNVWLTSDAHGVERVKVLDFGLARSVLGQTTTLTGPGTLFGTPSYMAPEAISGKEVGPPADLYALGLILHEMISGSKAFERDTIEATFAAHLFDQAPPMSPDVPRPLADLIRRLLIKDPNERLGRADEVRAGLEAAVEVLDPRRARTALQTATPAPEVVVVAAPAPRRSRVWVALVAVAAVGGVAWVVTRPSETPIAPIASAPVALMAEPDVQLAAVVPETIEAAAPEVVEAPEVIDAPEDVVPVVPEDVAPEAPEVVAVAKVALALEANVVAEVTLDGAPLGKTPLRDSHDALDGVHTLRFARRGYTTVTRKVKLDQDLSLKVFLPALDGEGFIVPNH